MTESAVQRVCVVTSAVMLVVSAAIYVLFRQDVIFLDAVREYLPEQIILSDAFLNRFLIYNLSDGLWYASLLCFERAINKGGAVGKVFRVMVIALPFVMETLQWMHVIGGTADIFDYLTFLITFIIFIIITDMKKLKPILSMFLYAAVIGGAIITWMACGGSSEKDLIDIHNAGAAIYNSARGYSYDNNVTDSVNVMEQTQIKGDVAMN